MIADSCSSLVQRNIICPSPSLLNGFSNCRKIYAGSSWSNVLNCLLLLGIHMASIPWTINATTTGHGLVYFVNRTIAIYSINVSNRTRSTRLQYHELSTPLHWGRSCLLCRPDNSDLLINVSNRTRSTWLQSRELSTPLHWAWSCLLCQTHNSDLLINVSNRTRSTWLQSRELSTPLQLGAILFAISTGQ